MGTIEREPVSKHEGSKTLKFVKGRKEYECANCGATINVGDYHAVEHLGIIRSSPGMVFNRYCMSCYGKHGESLIRMMQRGGTRGSLDDFSSGGS